jgi:hypothetical protein
MGRSAYGGFECSRKMEPAQARDSCKLIDRQVFFQVSLDVVQYAGQSASIQSLPCDTRVGLGGRWAGRRPFNQVDDRLAICVQPVAAQAKCRTGTLAQANDGAKETARGFEVARDDRCMGKVHQCSLASSPARQARSKQMALGCLQSWSVVSFTTRGPQVFGIN